MSQNNLDKVIFELEVTEGWPPAGSESVWAERQPDGSYRIDNIPFFVTSATFEDLILVTEIDGRLLFDRVIQYSGNSLIRIIVNDNIEAAATRQQFEAMGCTTEWISNFSMIALNVPPSANLPAIQVELQKGKAQEKWDYEEPLLHESPLD